VKACYLVDAITFAGSFYGVGRLPAMRVPGTRDKARGKLALTREGLSFIRRSQVLAGACAADVSATFFALPLSLFPAINAARFGGDPRILGLMPAAIGVGGMLTAVLAGPVRHVSRHGLAMIAAVCVWGLSLAVFAVTPWLWLTLLSLAIAGAADTYTVVFRQVIVQTVTPRIPRRVNAADYGRRWRRQSIAGVGRTRIADVAMISAPSGLLTIAPGAPLGAALRASAATAPPNQPPNRPRRPSPRRAAAPPPYTLITARRACSKPCGLHLHHFAPSERSRALKGPKLMGGCIAG
jgi:hypothetical protein